LIALPTGSFQLRQIPADAKLSSIRAHPILVAL
jgi:hypothetical protein